jgi:hypothetical protein
MGRASSCHGRQGIPSGPTFGRKKPRSARYGAAAWSIGPATTATSIRTGRRRTAEPGRKNGARGSCGNMDSHIQAAWNARALRNAGLVEPALIFPVVECQFSPFARGHAPDANRAPMADRDINRAIFMWGWCLKNNRWPGYRPETAWVGPASVEGTRLPGARGARGTGDRPDAGAAGSCQRRSGSARRPEPTQRAADAFGLEPIK